MTEKTLTLHEARLLAANPERREISVSSGNPESSGSSASSGNPKRGGCSGSSGNPERSGSSVSSGNPKRGESSGNSVSSESAGKAATAFHRKRTPSAKQLREGHVDIIVSRQINETTSITLYRNGYVLYTADKHSTVFTMPEETGYTYYSSDASSTVHTDDAFFDEQPWYLRLVLEGEDRLASNQRLRDENLGTFDYGDISELFEAEGKIRGEGSEAKTRTCKYKLSDAIAGSGLADKRKDMQAAIEERESLEEMQNKMKTLLTEKQFQAFWGNKISGMTQEKIAQRMGISQQAVNKLIDKAVQKMQKEMQELSGI